LGKYNFLIIFRTKSNFNLSNGGEIKEVPENDEETAQDILVSAFDSVRKSKIFKKMTLKNNFINKENNNRMTHILVELEIDKDLIGEMSFSLKESKSEKERFSSSMFNLKHFFGNKNRLANVFEMKLVNVFICEPFQYKICHLNAEQSNNKNCFLGFEIENILSKNVKVNIVDSDILIELSPELINGRFVKVQSNLLELIEYVIYNKNNVISINSFEKSNLLGRLTIKNDKKTDEKFRRVVESCHFCLKKSQIINEKSVSRFSKKDGEKSLIFSITAAQTGKIFLTSSLWF
jgi:hypothetical protein